MKSKIAIIAHRGASSYASENTLEAFRLAVLQKANAIEMDIRGTADGVLVISHDRGIKKGKKLLWIDKYTHDDLVSKTNRPLLSLSEVFQELPKETIFNLDIKQRGIEKNIVSLIKRHHKQHLVIIDSFYPGSIILFRRLLPRATLGLSLAIEDKRDLCRRIPVRVIISLSPYFLRRILGPLILKVAQNCHCDIVNMHVRFACKKNIDLLHSIGVKVFVWRVDKEKQMRRFIDLGVDGIKTGKPDVLRKVVESNGCNS